MVQSPTPYDLPFLQNVFSFWVVYLFILPFTAESQWLV